MVEFTKVGSFTKQIALFLKHNSYEKAYALAKQMMEKFPDKMITHFLLAKSAFWLGKYKEAVVEGQNAFNKCKKRKDMIACALLLGSAYFMTEEYAKGYKLLRIFKDDNDEGLKKMLLIFSIIVGKEEVAAEHAQELLEINSNAAEELMKDYAG